MYIHAYVLFIYVQVCSYLFWPAAKGVAALCLNV